MAGSVGTSGHRPHPPKRLFWSLLRVWNSARRYSRRHGARRAVGVVRDWWAASPVGDARQTWRFAWAGARST